MRDKTKRRFVAVASNLLMIAILLVGMAYAAVVNIDTFDQGTQELLVNSASTYVSDSVDGGTTGDVLGRYRDAQLEWISGEDNRTVILDIDTGGTTNDLAFVAGPNAQGEATIIWDGDQLPDTLSPTGLNNANLVSHDPVNDGILMVVKFTDQTAVLKFTGYEDASNHAELSYTVNQGDQRIDRLDLFFPFSRFVHTGIAGVDWSSLGALALDISGDTALDLVIDYIESTEEVREYGDLPDGSCPGIPDYSDVLDAYHIPRGLTLGANLDTEDAPNASCDAFGDDSNDFDDEDGVTPVYYEAIPGIYAWGANVTVNGCTDICWLNGWVDWNRDGDFDDTGEQVINNVSGSNSTLSTQRYLDLASNVSAGYYYLRFRVCDVASECDDPGVGNNDTRATNGEVEDYRWYLDPTAATLSSFTAAWQAGDVVVDWQTASEVGLAGFNVWRSTDPALHGEQLNATTIPPQTPGELTGNAYSYTDLTAVPGTIYYYWLEARQVGASSYWHGPMQPTGSFRVYLPVLLRGQ